MIERRKTPRKDWVIARTTSGAPSSSGRSTTAERSALESDPCARTYDFLERLEVTELSLEDDRKAAGLNPYDHG